MGEYENIKIVTDVRVGMAGEAGEITGGPFESDGAGEQGPESEEKNGGQSPELVWPALAKEPRMRVGVLFLPRRRRKCYSCRWNVAVHCHRAFSLLFPYSFVD